MMAWEQSTRLEWEEKIKGEDSKHSSNRNIFVYILHLIFGFYFYFLTWETRAFVFFPYAI